ncbi:MAG: helix-hairpin-helix domain-containing protein [Planctomycetota bacterium]|jgi:competence ComEA-like helix-hairpin-helix protein|nr:helix-hairpin-helix domain-containing protein [Planctomycetota bacterium]
MHITFRECLVVALAVFSGLLLCVGFRANGEHFEQVLAPYRVDLGEDDWVVWASISGIGEVKARAIVEYKRSVGGVQRVEDLKNVRGIGEQIVIRLARNVRTSR